MKPIALLSGGNSWHVDDLQRAARELGQQTQIVDFRKVFAGVAADDDELLSSGAVIVRTMPPGSLEQVILRMDVLHRLKSQGIPVLNPPRALETCIDKYLAAVRLEAAGLPIPPTYVCQQAEDALAAFEKLGADVVVKPLFGSEGRGMLRVDNADLAWRTFRTLERVQAVLYLQKFVAHPGWDLRIFVIKDQILCAMKRFGRNGWRTNVAQGGIAERAEIGEIESGLALRAAKATGLVVGGVDLLQGPRGEWYVLEVNAVPGWRTLSRVCRIDVASEIVQLITTWR